jgi:hypothetical protein
MLYTEMLTDRYETYLLPSDKDVKEWELPLHSEDTGLQLSYVKDKKNEVLVLN